MAVPRLVHTPRPSHPKISPAHAPSPAYNPAILFANIPRFVNSTLPVILSVGSAFFLLLLLIGDVWRSWRRKKHWIPGYYLILGALSLQLLGLMEYRILSIADERKLDQAVVKQLFETIQNKRLLILGQRVVMCVFMGIILPQFSTSRAQSRPNDMFALLFSAVPVLFLLIYYESYIIQENYTLQYREHFRRFNGSNNLLSTNLIFMFIFIILYALLLLANMTTKAIRRFVAYEAGSVLGSWKELEVETQAVQSWIMARTSQPEYIIARSILSASTGFSVTVPVVLFVVESFKINRQVTDVHFKIVLASQWSFVLLGWAIVCCRWVTAAVYYPRRKGIEDLRSRAHFWTKGSFLVLWNVPMEWNNFFKYSYKMHLVLLFFPSAICWMISEMVWFISVIIFSSSCMRRLVMGCQYYNEFSKLCKNESGNSDFKKFSPALMYMPWENPAGLWTANRKSIEKAKAQLKKGKSDAHKCKALISLPRNKTNLQVLNYMDPFAFPSEVEIESGFQFRKRSAKMRAVTLLTVIIELSAWYEELKSPNKVSVEECIDACQNAWKIMELVENKDREAALVNAEADSLFLRLTRRRRSPFTSKVRPMWLDFALPFNNCLTRNAEDAKKALQELAQKGKQKVDGGGTGRGYDYVSSTASIAVQNLEEVCNWINQCSVNNLEPEEMLYAIQISLAIVIRSCVWKVKDRIEERRMEADADMDKEEHRLWKALYVVGMANEITMMLQLDAAELHSRPLHSRPLHGRPPLPVDMSP